MCSIEGKSKKGFFLLEVLFIALILGIIAVPLIHSLNSILRAFKISNDFTRSIYLAEAILFQEVKSPGELAKEGEFPAPHKGFRWELEKKFDKFSGLYEVRVRIKDKKRVYAELVTLVKGK
ncbi:MAG: hypothetical protein NC920_02445 [Candidatus Omnitrophica bacterium]|nr:hypothetical protein [Candidatus Omnitrophota bacterium]MCM8798617.1 hypothetical protein [Candidatus Omnitrophota bacterium]